MARDTMGASPLRLGSAEGEIIRTIDRFFRAWGVEAYATGGFLRDALLGLAVHDIDISLAADPLVIGRRLADGLSGHYFALAEERQMARVLLPAPGLHIDLLPLTAPIEEDLRRRDYTIDAMAAPLAALAEGSLQLIDPTGGLADLRAGIVRATSEQALVDDPVRLLRGVRIATQLDFEIEPETFEMLRRRAALVSACAAERQRDELMRMLTTPRAGRGLQLMEDAGLLQAVLPETSVMRGVQQPKEHHWDVFGHARATVEALDILLAEAEPDEPSARHVWRELWSALVWWTGARGYLAEEIVMGTPRSAVLKLTGLLHDIGKPQTKSLDETGRIRFFGHGDVGAEIAVRLLQRLRFSAREVAMVRAMIEAHLRPLQMAQQGAPTRKAVYRFFRDTGEAGIDTLLLSLADHLGTVGPRLDMDGWQRHVALVNYIILTRFQEAEVVTPPRLLRGDELMAALGLSPGPVVGELLEMIREAQAEGEVTTPEEAIALAREHLRRQGGAH